MGHDLDEDELEVTRKLNGAAEVVTVSLKEIDEKIKDLEEESKAYDAIYCNGIIAALRAIRDGRVNEL